jgi:4-hydroxy-4-methyl-2-oxoglutarate aldolase
MATDTPALVIRRRFPRPDPAHVAALKDVPTGWVVDAQGRTGALAHVIRPVSKATRFVGVAVTVQTRARDNLAPYAAVDLLQPGDVVVVATGQYTAASTMGDIIIGMMRNCGAVAVVTDGMVRDVPGIDEVGIPVFALGVTPNSPFKDGPGEIGTAVAIGGMTVASGDVLVGDGDGVVVVRRETLPQVLAEIENVRAKEAKMEAEVAGGAKRPAWLDGALAAKGVRYLD